MTSTKEKPPSGKSFSPNLVELNENNYLLPNRSGGGLGLLIVYNELNPNV